GDGASREGTQLAPGRVASCDALTRRVAEALHLLLKSADYPTNRGSRGPGRLKDSGAAVRAAPEYKNVSFAPSISRRGRTKSVGMPKLSLVPRRLPMPS